MKLRCHVGLCVGAHAALDAPQYQFEGFLGKVFLVFHSVQGVMAISMNLDHCGLPARHCDSQVAHACRPKTQGCQLTVGRFILVQEPSQVYCVLHSLASMRLWPGRVTR